MTSLAVDYDETIANIAVVCGWSRATGVVGVWAGTTNLEDAQRMIRNGLRDFVNSYQWSFLNGVLEIVTDAPYSTGTIQVTSGVATITGGAWPTWAVQGWLEYDGRRHLVEVRTSPAEITLQDTTHDVPALTEFSLVRYQYSIPSDFAGLAGDLIYDPNQNCNYKIRPAMWEQIRERQAYIMDSRAPDYYAIYPQVFSPDSGQVWYIIFDPVPDGVYYFRGRYRRTIPELNETDENLPGDTVHAETILEAILSAAENHYTENAAGPHTMRYQRLLAKSIEYDKIIGSPAEIPRRCRTNADWQNAVASMRHNYIGLTNYQELNDERTQNRAGFTGRGSDWRIDAP